jgi:quinol monooxygenase YgiN
MSATSIRINPNIKTLVNVLTATPENQPELLKLLEEGTESLISKRHGWISTNLLNSPDVGRVIIYSQWESAKDIEAMRQDPAIGKYFQSVAALAKFESSICDVVYVHHA